MGLNLTDFWFKGTWTLIPSLQQWRMSRGNSETSKGRLVEDCGLLRKTAQASDGENSTRLTLAVCSLLRLLQS